MSAVLLRALPSALDRLAEADARFGEPWCTLDPDRPHARSLLALGRALVEAEPASGAPSLDAPAAEALGEGLVTIADAMHRAFPRNVFGDLDYLAASLWHGAGAATDGAVAFLREQCERVARLQRLFGCETAIHFRYVHDFLYGFDWAKWVSREPLTRAAIGPFAPEFLAYMDARGHELLDIIAAGHDPRYPPLPDQIPRNAFGFSREPADEIALHRHLAREGLLPVESWRIDATPRWDLPYARIRREHAARLGLTAGSIEPLRSV